MAGVISGRHKSKELFDVDIAWVIVSGWGQYRELMEYAIADRHNPRDTHLVPLGKHSMNVDFSPFLEVQFKGQPLGKLVFDVKMSFDLEGFLLTIQDSKIMKVRTGSCEGKGKIEFKGHCLVEKPLTKIILPVTQPGRRRRPAAQRWAALTNLRVSRSSSRPNVRTRSSV
jgi:hypothetical protein